MRRRTKRNLIIGSFAVLILAVAGLVWLACAQNKTIGAYLEGYRQLQDLAGTGDYGSTHLHADFQVYVNGKQIDFNKPEFYGLHPLTHMHEGTNNINVIHKHATGITYGMFFHTVGIELDQCMTVNGKEFCDLNGRTVKYYLNGKIVPSLRYVEISDLDKVLISYGSESLPELQAQLASIGDLSKVQSAKE